MKEVTVYLDDVVPFKIKKNGDKEIIRCSFNELSRIFGKYYEGNYYSIYNPFLYNEIKLYINK